MQGKLNVTYRLICDNDTYQEIPLQSILNNEKIAKLIKSEFAKGVRNLALSSIQEESMVLLSSKKELYHLEAQKKDFADIIELAEEDARSRKLFKKGCQAIEIVDLETI
jgi:hypothetical protein